LQNPGDSPDKAAANEKSPTQACEGTWLSVKLELANLELWQVGYRLLRTKNTAVFQQPWKD
jgi:hypothetical protein